MAHQICQKCKLQNWKLFDKLFVFATNRIRFHKSTSVFVSACLPVTYSSSPRFSASPVRLRRAHRTCPHPSKPRPLLTVPRLLGKVPKVCFLQLRQADLSLSICFELFVTPTVAANLFVISCPFCNLPALINPKPETPLLLFIIKLGPFPAVRTDCISARCRCHSSPPNPSTESLFRMSHSRVFLFSFCYFLLLIRDASGCLPTGFGGLLSIISSVLICPSLGLFGGGRGGCASSPGGCTAAPPQYAAPIPPPVYSFSPQVS